MIVMDNKPISSSKRTLLVVDGAYLFAGMSKINKRVNMIKFVQELETLINCEFYEKWFLNSTLDNNAQQNGFHNMLRAAPPSGPQFRVKLFGLKSHTAFCKRCKSEIELKVQKGVDVGIATLILKHSFQNLCDQVVLVGGDGDFYDALSTVKDELRKDMWIVGFRDGSVSLDLQQLAKIIWINDIIDRIEFRGYPLSNPPIPTVVHNKPSPKPITVDKPITVETVIIQRQSEFQQNIHKPVIDGNNTTNNSSSSNNNTNNISNNDSKPSESELKPTYVLPFHNELQSNVNTVWRCPVCTYDNPVSKIACEMCEEACPSAKQQQQSQSNAPAHIQHTPPPSLEFPCPICTFHRSSLLSACEMCGFK
jgi:uncharacterized LabA/DUF88 family protein